MSLVVPAYNEEERLNIMLREAVDYLEDEYGVSRIGKRRMQENGSVKQRHNLGNGHANGHSPEHEQQPEGWEILIVSDGSTDRTTQTALAFAKSLGAEAAGKVRVVELHQNRGKGGAVTHGLKHVRGRYAIFADADGASKFEDLGKLVTECARIEEADKAGRRAVAVGSRAHLVGSEAVVKVNNLSLPVDHCREADSFPTAILPPQPPHAFLPHPPPVHDTHKDCSYQRYTVRVQVILTSCVAIYHTFHAFRGLDLRCRDVDAC